MTPRYQKKGRRPSARARLRVTHPHAAGIDIHATVHWVAVPAEDAPAEIPGKTHTMLVAGRNDRWVVACAQGEFSCSLSVSPSPKREL
jgi:hypothetical protein